MINFCLCLQLQLKHKPRDDGWPLCFHGNVVVHLCEVERENLRQGDYYLYIKPPSPSSISATNNNSTVTLTLQYLTLEGDLEEIPVPASTFREVFTRNWLRDVTRDIPCAEKPLSSAFSSAMDLSSGGLSAGCPKPLSSFVIAGERGLQREDWRDIVQPPVMERRLSGRRSKVQRLTRGGSSAGAGSPGSGGKKKAGKLYLVYYHKVSSALNFCKYRRIKARLMNDHYTHNVHVYTCGSVYTCSQCACALDASSVSHGIAKRAKLCDQTHLLIKAKSKQVHLFRETFTVKLLPLATILVIYVIWGKRGKSMMIFLLKKYRKGLVLFIIISNLDWPNGGSPSLYSNSLTILSLWYQ